MERHINALKRVPECRLRIIDLAWKIAGENDKLDDSLFFHNVEVEAAVKEARAYASDTRKAVELLCRLARLNLSPRAF